MAIFTPPPTPTLGEEYPFEGRIWVYNGVGWGSGDATEKVFIENLQSVTASYEIPTGKNAVSTGPITIEDGATVTVPAGSRWIIL